MTTIAFTGGRDYTNDVLAYGILKYLKPDKVLVGDASGLDRLIRTFCNRSEIEYEVYKADWDKHGRAAGPIRNKEMLQSGAEILIAFPGGRGTENCIKQAHQLGIPVLRVDDN